MPPAELKTVDLRITSAIVFKADVMQCGFNIVSKRLGQNKKPLLSVLFRIIGTPHPIHDEDPTKVRRCSEIFVSIGEEVRSISSGGIELKNAGQTVSKTL
ncbi:unnamed protein product [Dibothriocephalus latus]|uniref:Uncharacterized protein n=1 Tax=Dibothriocephalus latus TaxID=60516 RepID=A0A3P7NSF2_DIBLA|nr:unnamed protein product [Dibothriocephalus latus]